MRGGALLLVWAGCGGVVGEPCRANDPGPDNECVLRASAHDPCSERSPCPFDRACVEAGEQGVCLDYAEPRTSVCERCFYCEQGELAFGRLLGSGVEVEVCALEVALQCLDGACARL